MLKWNSKYPQALFKFNCELTAIKEALYFYLFRYSDDSTGGLVVVSDSKSALETIRNGETNLTRVMRSLLSQINKPYTFQWIPAHMGIEGNERADTLANAAVPLVTMRIRPDGLDLVRISKSVPLVNRV